MARVKMVRLRYEFEFDPDKLWSSKNDFDHALADFFTAHNVSAEFIDFIGTPEISLLRLERTKLLDVPKAKPEKQKTVKQAFEDLRRGAKSKK